MVKPAKVFCIGAHKTGTTSMGAALTTLGFAVSPEARWYDDPSIQEDFYAGRYARLTALIDEYDAFEDSPFNHADFYRWLDGAYPGARFILTVRDAGHLIASHKRWLERLKTLVFDRDKHVERFVEFFWRHEYEQDDFIDDEEAIRRIYETRNRSVAEFFSARPEQLLVLDLEKDANPWDRLCAFLDVRVPPVVFPHLKRTV